LAHTHDELRHDGMQRFDEPWIGYLAGGVAVTGGDRDRVPGNVGVERTQHELEPG